MQAAYNHRSGAILAESKHRRATVIILAMATLFLLLLLGALNAFKLNFLEPRSIEQIQLFSALSIVVFLLFAILLVLLLVGSVPAWPYSRSWGYFPSGTLGLILIILIIMLMVGRL